MSLQTKQTCPECHHKFEPIVAWQEVCSERCGNRRRQRHFRERKRYGGGGPGGGGGRQRRLFPKPVLAKPPRAEPVPAPTLFENDLLASLGGAVEYGEDSALGPIRDHNRYSVKSDSRKPSVRAAAAGAPHAA
jgi:hypothetical protein